MKLKGIIIFQLLLAHTVFSQEKPHYSPPIPAEIFLGNKYLSVQVVITKLLKEGSRWGYFNLSTFAGDYKNTVQKNEIVSQSLLTFKVYKGFSLTSGLAMNYKTGLRKIVGFQYTYANPTWLVVSVPSYDLNDGHNAELMNLVEYKPKISKNLGLYTRFQTLYVHSTKLNQHERSSIFTRVGLSRNNFQFGVGFNADWYGPHKASGLNTGVFGRVLMN
jgi:hypothetical protein